MVPLAAIVWGRVLCVFCLAASAFADLLVFRHSVLWPSGLLPAKLKLLTCLFWGARRERISNNMPYPVPRSILRHLR